jgi:hypothetical protein
MRSRCRLRLWAAGLCRSAAVVRLGCQCRRRNQGQQRRREGRGRGAGVPHSDRQGALCSRLIKWSRASICARCLTPGLACVIPSHSRELLPVCSARTRSMRRCLARLPRAAAPRTSHSQRSATGQGLLCRSGTSKAADCSVVIKASLRREVRGGLTACRLAWSATRR